MPVIQIDLMEGHSEATHRALLERCTASFAEIVGGPVERFRSTIVVLPAAQWALGGQAAPARVSPLIRFTLLQGRPPELLRRLLLDVSQVAADVLGIPLDDTRAIITEIPATHWGIGGVPASEARAAEVAARAAASP